MAETPWADVKAIRHDAVRAGLRPPPRLTLSEWADEHFRLSSESAASAGRWKTLPYQKGIMDAITDPKVTHISVMKSARVGYTLVLSAAVGYFIHQAPCSILLVQPTVDDAKGFSKETIAPMLRDVPALSTIVEDEIEEKGARDSGQTILSKRYPGGVLSVIGATSGSGFRRVSRKVVCFDEVDAYPASAGSDGDPIKLGTKRAAYFWDRKIIAGSTPLVSGHSRIETMFLAGDQRRFYVPCPQCGHMDFLVFTENRNTGGHFMVFDKEAPADAHFVCSKNGCVIEHKDKRAMVAGGEWRGAQPFVDHASFHIWAAYSFAPNATWGQIAAEFLEAKSEGSESLRVFVNTVLGETWKEIGEAPDWERLYHRREQYKAGTVPHGVTLLTCGVDVQKNRWVYEVVGWAPGKESWSIDSGAIPGDTSNEADWHRLEEVLGRQYPGDDGLMHRIRMMAIDAGFNTQAVYNFVRLHERTQVIAVKGDSKARVIHNVPSAVDVTHNGRKIARGAAVWPIGVDIAKTELYGWLRLATPLDPTKEYYPHGYCHFPEHPPEFFKQLTAEHLVSTVDRRGFKKYEWQVIPNRENHALDARIYARAAASILGLDRVPLPTRPPRAEAPAPVAVSLATPRPVPAAPAPVARLPFRSKFTKGGKWL